MKPWKTLATVTTAEGPLELRQRGDKEFLLVIAGRVLMTSQERRSEERLATLALARVKSAAPRILIGGLGMAYTLRAALDALPAGAKVDVVELVPAVAEWCKGPLAPLTAGAAADPRVTVILGDVARVIRDAAPGTYDAILLDLYEGPHAASQRGDDPFYGPGALARSRAALVPGGVLAVWSEDPDDAFLRRFRAAGYTVDVDRSGTSRVHLVYVGMK
ncbi:MAG: spermidine synthase [Kofleriaceae bacterium]